MWFWSLFFFLNKNTCKPFLVTLVTFRALVRLHFLTSPDPVIMCENPYEHMGMTCIHCLDVINQPIKLFGKYEVLNGSLLVCLAPSYHLCIIVTHN